MNDLQKRQKQRKKTYRQWLLRNIVVTESQTLETTVSTYRERSFNETDFNDENEEESETFDEKDEFSKKE